MIPYMIAEAKERLLFEEFRNQQNNDFDILERNFIKWEVSKVKADYDYLILSGFTKMVVEIKVREINFEFLLRNPTVYIDYKKVKELCLKGEELCAKPVIAQFIPVKDSKMKLCIWDLNDEKIKEIKPVEKMLEKSHCGDKTKVAKQIIELPLYLATVYDFNIPFNLDYSAKRHLSFIFPMNNF